MYYKITNKDSKIYKDLYEMRSEEILIEKRNIESIDKKIGLEYESFLGNDGQQNFRRVSIYQGFVFSDPTKVDLKIWKRHSEYPSVFVPNKKTKIGREMSEFLANGLESSRFNNPIDIMGLTKLSRFTFPYVEISEEIILIYVDERHGDPKDPNLIEITKKEFEILLNQTP